MSQSAFIAGALLAGFVLYLLAAGRLGVYFELLLGKQQFGGTSYSGGGGAGPATTLTPPQSAPGSLIPPNFPYTAPIPGANQGGPQ